MAKATEVPDVSGFSTTVTRVLERKTDGVRVLTGTTASVPASDEIEINISAILSNYNMCKIVYYDIVASASTDFDVEIYPTDAFDTNEFLVQETGNNLVMKSQPIGGDLYEDRDASGEIHMKIKNEDAVNASTFTYHIYYEV